MTTKREIFRNVAATGLARLGSVVLGIAVTVLIARKLGPAGFGYYISIFSAVTLVDFALEAAIVRIAVREIAKSPELKDAWVTSGTVLRLVSGALAYIGCLAVAHAVAVPPEVRKGASVAGLILLVNAFRMPVALFRSSLMIQWELLVTLLSRSCELAMVFALASAGGGLVEFLGARLLACVVYGVAAWRIAWSRFALRVSFRMQRLKEIARRSLPLGLEALLVTIQLKADILIVSVMMGPEAGGLYGIVAQILEFSMLVPEVFLTPLFPVLTRDHESGQRARFQATYQRAFELFMALAIPAAVIVSIFPGECLRIVFGEKYLGAAPLLRWLVWVVVLMYFAGVVGTAAVALNKLKSRAWIEAVNVAAYLTLIFVLIGKFGYWAGVVSRFVAVVMGSSLTCWVVARERYALRTDFLAWVIGAGALLGAVVLLLVRLDQMLAFLAAIVLYAVVVWRILAREWATGLLAGRN